MTLPLETFRSLDTFSFNRVNCPSSLIIPPSFQISGHGKDGFPIKRVTSTAISSSLPEKPRIAMKLKVIAAINAPFSLYCHVTSLVPFTVTWLRNGAPIDPILNYPLVIDINVNFWFRQGCGKDINLLSSSTLLAGLFLDDCV